MKKILVLFCLFFAAFAKAQTAVPSKDSLRRMPVRPPSTKIFALTEAGVTKFYAADYADKTSPDDGETVLCNKGQNYRFLKLVQPAVFSYDQRVAIAQMITDSLRARSLNAPRALSLNEVGRSIADSLHRYSDSHVIYFDSTFGGQGTQRSPFTIPHRN